MSLDREDNNNKPHDPEKDITPPTERKGPPVEQPNEKPIKNPQKDLPPAN